MKVFFKSNRILPNDSITDLIDKAGLEDHEYHCASCNSYFSEEETARKQKSDYIVYIFSDFLMRDVYFNEVAMEAVLDIKSFTSKVIIIDEIETPNKISPHLHNKISDYGGYWFGKIERGAHFIHNKKMAEKPKEKQEGFLDDNTLDEYQREAIGFDDDPRRFPDDTLYFIGLAGEVGEVVDKYKKLIRGNKKELVFNKCTELLEELGDVLWYVAAIAGIYGCSLSQVADLNIRKLKKRQKERSE